ncbi:cytochrome P450 [Streptomyces sp. NPDC096132]|uniref:cytochrome P450 n=1 Tax=Streptomyces sp. NPDC096132 TaxID=3366075 RepID=UPI00381211D4
MTIDDSMTRPYDEIDLSSRDFWSTTAAERERAFAVLRAERPVSWHAPAESLSFVPRDPNDRGYWAVTRHADIVEVSRRNDVFVSSDGVLFDTFPQDVLEASMSILAMDPPKHTKIRKLVSAAFTPKQVKRIQDLIEANAKAIVQKLAATGSGADFVAHCAARLPILTLSYMVGIPEEEHDKVAEAAEALLSTGDPVFLAGRNPVAVLYEGQAYLRELALDLAGKRRHQPEEDLMTNMVQAEVDGETLTNEEIAAFFILLCVAGNDTTRQTTSHTLKALTDHPGQRAWLMEDYEGRINQAMEEFVRWAGPVMTFRRTAVADVELGGRQIRAGEKVVMFYSSGNWDTEVFTDPSRYDLSRAENPHVSFGGGGAHYCLGNQVAKAQLKALFRELLTQLPDIKAGEPELLTSNLIHGVRAMPCYF